MIVMSSKLAQIIEEHSKSAHVSNLDPCNPINYMPCTMVPIIPSIRPLKNSFGPVKGLIIQPLILLFWFSYRADLLNTI